MTNKIQSVLSRCAICLLEQFSYELFKYPSALFVILELIEAGASRREKHDVAWLSVFAGILERPLQCATIDKWHRTFEGLFQ